MVCGLGSPQKVDDHENSAIEDRVNNFAADEGWRMGRAEARQQSWSEAQESRTVIDQNNDLLQQMSMHKTWAGRMQDVQILGRQMQE